MNRPQPPEAAGFTLVEVLVALTILSISITVLLQIFSTNLDRARESGSEMLATSLAQSLLEQAGTTMSLHSASGEFSNGLRWRLDVQPYGSAADRKAWPVDAVTVTASTFWSDGKKSVALATLRLVPKEAQ